MNTPFNSIIIRDWLLNISAYHNINIKHVVTTGSGPFNEADFDEFLRKNNIQPCNPSSEIEVVIVGSDDWDQNKLFQMLLSRKGETLRVYSQEMFMTFLLTGIDPFSGNREILMEFAKGHRSLIFLSSINGFEWPTTNISPSINIGNIVIDRPKKGLLKALGYKVGNDRKPTSERHQILTRAFNIKLLESGKYSAYLAEWGDPAMPQRLLKMANCIASFCKNAKRKVEKNMDPAIEDWESDLEWLKKTYYDRLNFRFNWPDTEVY